MIDQNERLKRVRKALSEMTPEQRQRAHERYLEFVLWVVAQSGPPGPMGHLADLGYILGKLCAADDSIRTHRPSTRLWLLGYHVSRFGRPVGDSEIASVAPVSRGLLATMRRELARYGLAAKPGEAGGYAYTLPAEAMPAGLMDAVYQQSDLRFLYAIQAADDGPVKLGISRDVEARQRALQSTNSEPLHIRGVIPQSRNSQESAVHARFKEERIRGEWFRLSGALAEWIARYSYPPQSSGGTTARKGLAWMPQTGTA